MVTTARPPKDPDESLVSDAIRGSSGAFGVLFERYEQRIFRIAYRVLRNREDAEDAVQQAFARAFVHLHKFQGQSRFSTWLTRIAINEALMLIRKRHPGHTSIERPGPVEAENRELEIADSAATPEQHCGQQQVHAFLIDAIRSLKPMLRQVVQLYDIGELSTNETGEILGLRRCTVKARVFRARSELRRKLAGVWNRQPPVRTRMDREEEFERED
jgi:RNA polymerase sigma-70 factor (ECF subfamily)